VQSPVVASKGQWYMISFFFLEKLLFNPVLDFFSTLRLLWIEWILKREKIEEFLNKSSIFFFQNFLQFKRGIILLIYKT
jgi:hypothetical protein